jgi:D-alanine-D-alanine ligase
VKWNAKYQKKVGIDTGAAKNLPQGVAEKVQHITKRVYKVLELSGYARIDLRLDDLGQDTRARSEPEPADRAERGLRRVCRAGGLPYPALLQRILTAGIRWEPERPG